MTEPTVLVSDETLVDLILKTEQYREVSYQKQNEFLAFIELRERRAANKSASPLAAQTNGDFHEFEIIDQHGARWRYKRAEGYSWSWAILDGTLDADDRSLVEVWLPYEDENEGSRVVASFPNPALVGDVTPNTCLNYGFREIMEERLAAKNNSWKSFKGGGRSVGKTL